MSTAALALLISVLLVLVVVAYYWFKIRGVTSKPKGNAPPPQSRAAPNIHDGKTRNMSAVPVVVKPMYKPSDVGHRTGHKRVFISSKGLRVYDTNEHGWPMPPIQKD